MRRLISVRGSTWQFLPLLDSSVEPRKASLVPRRARDSARKILPGGHICPFQHFTKSSQRRPGSHRVARNLEMLRIRKCKTSAMQRNVGPGAQSARAREAGVDRDLIDGRISEAVGPGQVVRRAADLLLDHDARLRKIIAVSYTHLRAHETP